MMRTISTIAVALALVGCATAPTKDELGKADYGERPQNYVQTIHQYFDSTLKDPSSVQYKDITSPQQDWIRDAPIQGHAIHFGWGVLATVNAKNSYGGYTGYQTYHFLFRGERIDQALTPDTPVAGVK
jgi:hypothetical protein